MGHRFAAGLLFLWILWATIYAMKRYKHQPIMYWGWLIALILVSCQVATGALVVFTGLNLYVALAHAFFISCLFGVLSYFVLLATRSKKEKEVGHQAVPSAVLK